MALLVYDHYTANGRIDMLVKTQDYIYILEFKLDKSADEALHQIEAKQYAKPFEHDGRTIYKIGVNFSTETRRIDGWKILKAEDCPSIISAWPEKPCGDC